MRMRKRFAPVAGALLLGLTLAAPPVRAEAPLSSDWAEGHNSRARLIAGNKVAGVEVEMADGWKTYWRNPGDAGGVPPAFDLSKSTNLAAAKILYPAPKRFSDSAGDTIGYKGTVVFPIELTPKDPSKPIDLNLTLDYGVCREICIPAEAALSLAIAPKGKYELPPELADALKRVPAPESGRRPGDPVLKRVVQQFDGPKPRLVLEAQFPQGAKHADIFIEAPEGLYVPMPKKVSDDGAGNLTFAIDLADDVAPKDLKNQKLTATLVSDAGQSEAIFSVD